jgi:hypothetical protein
MTGVAPVFFTNPSLLAPAESRPMYVFSTVVDETDPPAVISAVVSVPPTDAFPVTLADASVDSPVTPKVVPTVNAFVIATSPVPEAIDMRWVNVPVPTLPNMLATLQWPRRMLVADPAAITGLAAAVFLTNPSLLAPAESTPMYVSSTVVDDTDPPAVICAVVVVPVTERVVPTVNALAIATRPVPDAIDMRWVNVPVPTLPRTLAVLQCPRSMLVAEPAAMTGPAAAVFFTNPRRLAPAESMPINVSSTVVDDTEPPAVICAVVVVPVICRVPPTVALLVTPSDASVEAPVTCRVPPTVSFPVTPRDARVEAPETPRVPPSVPFPLTVRVPI